MKTKLLVPALLMMLMALPAGAQGIQAIFSSASFYSPAAGPYVETYLKVFGPSAVFVKNDAGNYQASLLVTLVFKRNDTIVDYRKYNLLSEELQDTVQGFPNLLDQQRIPLPSGKYLLEVSMEDNNRKESGMSASCEVNPDFNAAGPRFSDIEFVESYQATETENVLSKSGFDLVPFVSDFYPPSVDAMSFYTELYRINELIGDKEDFLIKYRIESLKDKVVLENFSKYKRQKSAPVNPLLVSLSIADLPNGNYSLVVEAVNRNNEVMARQSVAFQRVNPGLQLNESDIRAVDVSSTFAEQITSLDSLRFYLESLNPVGNSNENLFVEKIVKTDDAKLMQKFLYSFWKTRNDQYPESEWNSYKMQVLAIEGLYKTKIKHGYETDMGYIWLKYGTPNEVDDSRHEPNAVPYVVWYYWHVKDQSDVKFVFYNPHLVGTEYSLMFSNAREDRINLENGLYNRTKSFGSSGGYGSRYNNR